MTDGEAIRCSCGAKLLDSVDGREVVVDGERFEFARATDYVICDSCGHLHRVNDLQPGENPAVGAAIDELSRLAQPRG